MSNDDRSQQVCVGCRTRAPETNTEYTLISSRFGWRLTRRLDRDGTFMMEWRCPACWQKYKAERQLATTPSEGIPAVASELPPSSRRPTFPEMRPLRDEPPPSTSPGTPRKR